MALTMRSDLQPICPTHHAVMVPCQLVQDFDGRISYKPCYVCTTPGCGYHWDVLQGYFSAHEGSSIKRDLVHLQKCNHDGSLMFIADFEPQKSKRTWKCGQIGCAGGRVTEAS
jgi:hypothetical protein